jgi:hypothetical protein
MYRTQIPFSQAMFRAVFSEQLCRKGESQKQQDG